MSSNREIGSQVTAKDESFMARALELADKAKGKTFPNPAVGCVIVRKGSVVGEGYHPQAGSPHAEVFALRAAGQQAEGATAYVTLEPCNHYGRTPPCSLALIEAGVSRVRTACPWTDAINRIAPDYHRNPCHESWNLACNVFPYFKH